MENRAKPLSVLVVDDEPTIRRSLSVCLELEGHAVATASGVQEALGAAACQAFDLAFVDLRLGAESGLDLVPRLLGLLPSLKIVVITAYASIETAVEAMRRGAWDYLQKPFEPSQVAAAAAKVAALRLPGEGDAGLIFDSASPAMREAVRLARQVAPRDVTVLLRGESGTGKSALARALHGWSPRSAGPFATVSCPSLSADLLASELFGHVRGAFTGAVADVPGRVESCHGGTLFLDEIGDLPLDIQPKLLRLLQEREYERVGEARTRKADVRIVAATHVDLAQAVREGRFREDLYWRLNVVEITLPSLSERREDVPVLANVALARACRGARTVLFAPGVAEALAARPWPGNLRELFNAVERAVALGEGGMLGPEAFEGAASLSESVVSRDEALVPLERLEELHIRRVLAATRTLEQAARVLGIDSATLWRKRKRYGI